MNASSVSCALLNALFNRLTSFDVQGGGSMQEVGSDVRAPACELAFYKQTSVIFSYGCP